jgi:hypothetical protein
MQREMDRATWMLAAFTALLPIFTAGMTFATRTGNDLAFANTQTLQ